MDKKDNPDPQTALIALLRQKLSQKYIAALLVIAVVGGFLLYSSNTVPRPEPASVSEEGAFAIGQVKQVIEEGEQEVFGQKYAFQVLEVNVQNGEDAGKTVEVRNEIQPGGNANQKLSSGESIIITMLENGDETSYFVADRYRVPAIILIFGIFVGLTVVFGGLKGLTSLIGLAFTLCILVVYVTPAIVAGQDPMLVAVIGSLLIGLVSFYFAHGFEKRVTIALASSIITIMIGVVLSSVFVQMANLSGTGSEEALLLSSVAAGSINLRGLLLGGIIFGIMGVLDDVTTAQTSAVEQLKLANQKFGFKELYTRAISIGREHIVSLVNTLVLAYVGSSFPLLLLFSLNQGVPLWLTLNSEFLIEEIIRALIGSSALIFAVPLSTGLAAYFFSKSKTETNTPGVRVHQHTH